MSLYLNILNVPFNLLFKWATKRALFSVYNRPNKKEQYTFMKNKLLMNKAAVDQEIKQKDNINLWKNLPDV